jgi:hypothetical protein
VIQNALLISSAEADAATPAMTDDSLLPFTAIGATQDAGRDSARAINRYGTE